MNCWRNASSRDPATRPSSRPPNYAQPWLSDRTGARWPSPCAARYYGSTGCHTRRICLRAIPRRSVVSVSAPLVLAEPEADRGAMMCSAERRWSLPLRRNLIALRDMEEKALHSGALPGMRVGARLRPSGPRVSPLPSALAVCERRLTLLLGDITGPSAGV
ncbi:uncharacterized protein TRAVEDRAFT_55937, partial [Trametes versicolor FP-101664 SS1]|uniref:uncharacterized protein n=1 Tax=Trametes versicolor (strain FP-101664) TaxID=717944 RepID=UPI0004622346